MEGRPPKLILDTSAINALGKDTERKAIIEGLCIAYFVGITVTALSEIVATPDEADRSELLDVLKRLLACGQCIMPFNWIIEGHAKAYQANSATYDWRNLAVRFREAEQEIARQEYMHDLSEQTKEENRKAEKEFKAIFTKAKPAFDKLFVNGRERPSLEEIAKVLVAEGGAHFEIAADLVERATGKRPTSSEIKDFVERCPPFKALIMALCFTQYDLCIRGENIESLGKAGRVDMFSAAFIPYCRVFVTNDEGQYKALTKVAQMTGVDTSIMMYQDFRKALIGLKG